MAVVDSPLAARLGRSWMSPVRRLGRWLRGPEFADVVLLTVGLRLVLLLWAPIAVTVFGSELARSRDFLEIWNNWDSPHYLAIARGWYDPARDPAEIAFMPLLPVIIRVLSEFMAPLVAGMVVSLVMTIAAGLAIYRLALLDADRTVARAAVLALNVFPTSFAFVPPYTEPLFLGLAAWAFLRARRDDWIGASMLGMLASLARIQGLLLVPALIVEYVSELSWSFSASSSWVRCCIWPSTGWSTATRSRFWRFSVTISVISWPHR